jgi:hypothetical protein
MADFDPLTVWFPQALQFLRRSRELKSQGYVVSFLLLCGIAVQSLSVVETVERGQLRI